MSKASTSKATLSTIEEHKQPWVTGGVIPRNAALAGYKISRIIIWRVYCALLCVATGQLNSTYLLCGVQVHLRVCLVIKEERNPFIVGLASTDGGLKVDYDKASSWLRPWKGVDALDVCISVRRGLPHDDGKAKLVQLMIDLSRDNTTNRVQTRRHSDTRNSTLQDAAIACRTHNSNSQAMRVQWNFLLPDVIPNPAFCLIMPYHAFHGFSAGTRLMPYPRCRASHRRREEVVCKAQLIYYVQGHVQGTKC
jgi:hypothetical protein